MNFQILLFGLCANFCLSFCLNGLIQAAETEKKSQPIFPTQTTQKQAANFPRQERKLHKKGIASEFALSTQIVEGAASAKDQPKRGESGKNGTSPKDALFFRDFSFFLYHWGNYRFFCASDSQLDCLFHAPDGGYRGCQCFSAASYFYCHFIERYKFALLEATK
jgi:hypothetical protein